MEKNKTGKYLKYAIGEIILVVIGILIALQINNWNEERKTKALYNSYRILLMQELNQELENLINLDSIIRINKKVVQDYFIYINESSEDNPAFLLEKIQTKNINKLFVYQPYQPLNTTLNDLNNSGNIKLFNSKVRGQIITVLNARDSYLRNRDREVNQMNEYRNEISKILGSTRTPDIFKKLKVKLDDEIIARGINSINLSHSVFLNLMDIHLRYVNNASKEIEQLLILLGDDNYTI